MLDGVRVELTGIGHFAVANDGTLIYRTSDRGFDLWTAPRSFVWVDRDGREEALSAPARPYAYPRLSPDGTHVAFDIRDQENDLWVWDVDRETLSRLTFGAGTDSYAVWTPDGQHVVYRSSADVFRRAFDGTGEPERLTNGLNPFPYTISPDGTHMVLRVPGTNNSLDLVTTGLSVDADVEPLLTTEFNERNAEVAPDGRWMAYESDESGQFEIYVRPFPEVDSGRWQVSTEGGSEALWSPRGDELFYRTLDGRVMAVAIQTEDGFTWGNVNVVVAERYFDGPNPFWGRMYDVSPDGQRFLMIKEGDNLAQSDSAFVVVTNWFEEPRGGQAAASSRRHPTSSPRPASATRPRPGSPVAR